MSIKINIVNNNGDPCITYTLGKMFIGEYNPAKKVFKTSVRPPKYLQTEGFLKGNPRGVLYLEVACENLPSKTDAFALRKAVIASWRKEKVEEISKYYLIFAERISSRDEKNGSFAYVKSIKVS